AARVPQRLLQRLSPRVGRKQLQCRCLNRNTVGHGSRIVAEATVKSREAGLFLRGNGDRGGCRFGSGAVAGEREIKEGVGIDPCTVELDAPMEMRSGRAAGSANLSNHLAG